MTQEQEILAEIKITITTDVNRDEVKLRFSPLSEFDLTVDMLKEIARMINELEPEFEEMENGAED